MTIPAMAVGGNPRDCCGNDVPSAFSAAPDYAEEEMRLSEAVETAGKASLWPCATYLLIEGGFVFQSMN